MSGKFLARASALLLTLFLVACGGGGDGSAPLAGTGDSSSGGSTDDGSSTDDDTSVTVGDITLITDAPQIGTSADSQAILTASVQDSNGLALSGIPVTFSVSKDSASNPAATLIVADDVTDDSGNPVTDENGTITAVLKNNKSQKNQTITVTATAGDPEFKQ